MIEFYIMYLNRNAFIDHKKSKFVFQFYNTIVVFYDGYWVGMYYTIILIVLCLSH